MNRILEFQPSQEEAVVSRILVLVHQAVDVHFPAAEHATRQFTKTVFSDDGEKTALTALPREAAAAFGSNEDTSPDGRPNGDAAAHAPVPPPPPPRPSAASTTSPVPRNHAQPKAEKPSSSVPGDSAGLAGAGDRTSSGSRATGLETSMKGLSAKDGADWVTRIFLALLIAGLVLLAYMMLGTGG